MLGPFFPFAASETTYLLHATATSQEQSPLSGRPFWSELLLTDKVISELVANFRLNGHSGPYVDLRKILIVKQNTDHEIEIYASCTGL